MTRKMKMRKLISTNTSIITCDTEKLKNRLHQVPVLKMKMKEQILKNKRNRYLLHLHQKAKVKMKNLKILNKYIMRISNLS